MWRFYVRSAALTTIVLILIAISTAILAQENHQPAGAHEQGLALVEQHPSPVLTVKSPGAEGNKHGFEGGNVVKLGGVYHLVTTEMAGENPSVNTNLAHWMSSNRLHWKRVSTLYESSGEFTGQDPRAALWGPMLIYDEQSQTWNLIYVAYRAAPDTKSEWRYANFEGTIWRAVSRVKGPGGIDGPYVDVGVILRPDADSQWWEGLQGTDSFFAYRVGQHWLGFYGSSNTEHQPPEHWRVGLAEAAQLAGPWKRCVGVNPVYMDKRFVENPIVTNLDDGSYMAVYDNEHPNAVGYAWSSDGLNWKPGRDLVVQPKGKGSWTDHIRTPLGLIPEGRGRFTLFYTAYQRTPGSKELGPEAIGFVSVKLQPQN
jgi:hypothetical protein